MNENLFSFSAISGQGEQPKFDSTAFDLGSDVNAGENRTNFFISLFNPRVTFYILAASNDT